MSLHFIHHFEVRACSTLTTFPEAKEWPLLNDLNWQIKRPLQGDWIEYTYCDATRFIFDMSIQIGRIHVTVIRPNAATAMQDLGVACQIAKKHLQGRHTKFEAGSRPIPGTDFYPLLNPGPRGPCVIVAHRLAKIATSEELKGIAVTEQQLKDELKQVAVSSKGGNVMLAQDKVATVLFVDGKITQGFMRPDLAAVPSDPFVAVMRLLDEVEQAVRICVGS
jgi:hypothetical protein